MQTAQSESACFPAMTDEQFSQWAELIEQRTGMHLPQERRSFLVTSLSLRMREVGYTNYNDYFTYLQQAQQGTTEWMTLVDRLTVHETRFFRHAPTMEFLRQEFLPELISLSHRQKSVKIWSAGCSTGEEPYSLAMLVDDYIRQFNLNLYLGVTGTDISLPALQIAREGIYNNYKLRHVPEGLRHDYFGEVSKGHYKVKDELRRRVCFTPSNIVDMAGLPIKECDLICCQNLLIYFNRNRRLEIIDNLVRRLRKDGLLILGAGEVLSKPHPELEPVEYPNTLIFRRK